MCPVDSAVPDHQFDLPFCSEFGLDVDVDDDGLGKGRYCSKLRIRLCHAAGGKLEQIQFLLGHASVETTERHLGRTQQRLRSAVNDCIGLEP